MTCYCIYTRAGSFVCRFDSAEKAELWRLLRSVTEYTIRKEYWK